VNEAMLNPVMKYLCSMCAVAAFAIPAEGCCLDLSLSFEKGQVVSFVTTATKMGSEESHRQYNERKSDLAAPFGFRREGMLRITSARAGNFVPDQFIQVLSWPSRSSVEKFNASSEWVKLRETQKDILDELRINSVIIPQDMTITFQNDKIYRVVSLWINPDYPNDFFKYRDALSQTVSQQGGHYILQVEDGNYISYVEPDRPPDLFWIIEWPDRDSHQSYISSDTFRANYRLFQSGVARFNVFETELVVPTSAGNFLNRSQVETEYEGALTDVDSFNKDSSNE